MKMLELQPARGSFRSPLRTRWSLGAGNGKRIHGHNLIWCGTSGPRRGSAGHLDARVAARGDAGRTSARSSHWKGQVASWDVVNESLGPDGSMRDCVWKRVIGPDYVEQALRRRARPTRRRTLRQRVRGRHAERPLRRRRGAGARLHGARRAARRHRLQYHLYGREPFQHQTEEVLRRIGALGLAVHISELDDKTSAIAGTTEEKLAKQGRSFQTVASACQAVPACTRVTTWGVSDQWSWRGTAEMASRSTPATARSRRGAALQQELRPAPVPVGKPPTQPGTIRTGVKYDRGTYLVSWEPART